MKRCYNGRSKEERRERQTMNKKAPPKKTAKAKPGMKAAPKK